MYIYIYVDFTRNPEGRFILKGQMLNGRNVALVKLEELLTVSNAWNKLTLKYSKMHQI